MGPRVVKVLQWLSWWVVFFLGFMMVYVFSSFLFFCVFFGDFLVLFFVLKLFVFV